ncbi:uncharacterized protein LOC123542864 [Mercenaria mercenaria]|uniref:uncharacterized protein LOC123542864 n=1 Tax=Mercenaria mercenaria TaxID=6596 RepID=UPI00234F1AE4|nr:uncharacterized protein LOC123542864 [Mercenaria mercenaria]
MRLIITMSVTMLLVVAFAEDVQAQRGESNDGTGTGGAVPTMPPDDGSSDNSGVTEKANQEASSANNDVSGCGEQNADYKGVLRLEETVDAKTAKKIMNLIKKGRQNVAGGRANGKRNVKVTLETNVNYDNKDLLATLDKEESACSAKSGSNDGKGNSNGDRSRENSQNGAKN